MYYRSTPPKVCTHQASAVLAVVIVLGAVSAMLAFSTAKATQSGLRATDSNRVTLQAQQYAASEAELLRSVTYADSQSFAKSDIDGTKFKKEVRVGGESNYSGDIKQKDLTIRVFYDNEILPRASMKLTRYSVAQKGTFSAKAFQIPYNGSVSYTLPGDVKHISVLASTVWTPHLGSDTTNVVSLGGIGTLSMYTFSDRHGSKGYGYDYTTTSTASADFSVNLSSGSILTISTSVKNPFGSGHASTPVYHTDVLLVMS